MVCGNFFVEKAVEQEVPEQRIAPECGGDIVQKVCLNDTAGAENSGDRSQVK